MLTLNRQRFEQQELRIVWEFNPHYRGRKLWKIWQFLPYIIVNAWV